jgi:hypothetical protein
VDAEYLESWENDDALMRKVPRAFLVTQPAPYGIYRLNIATNNGANATQLADLILYSARPAGPPIPVVSDIKAVNGNLTLTGAGGVPLGDYSVLVSTNLSLPLNRWSVVGSSQFDDVGGFVYTNALSSNFPALFFSLRVP